MRNRFPMSRGAARATAALLLVLLIAAPTVAQAPADAAPVLDDPTAEGIALVDEYMTILGLPVDAKAERLDELLGPGFQVVRANGDRQDRAEYLASPPTVEAYTITDASASQDDDVLVVSYVFETSEVVDGVAQTTTAPRLTVFHWGGDGWQLAAHANFGAIVASDADELAAADG
ncbi:MAG: nuclear transport factor 2 family protein [Candidatus Limnocylindrales bacterium]|jgi:hypothetical protein